MFSHLFISVTDFDAAFDFYHALMAELGLGCAFVTGKNPGQAGTMQVVRGHCW